MKITNDEIKHVARLARLYLSDEEEKRMEKDLGAILTFMDKLNNLDTAGVPQTAHAVETSNVLREDVAAPSFDREELLKNAPTVEDGCYSVPKVVE
ncbi:MAG: Asp-tRNA(Asn)/Glu-tRNA(Gln) amidotransferase subunit GatC [Clostridia bacterium]|nr:Asp-tRNA(Asn)/Glu-tRNA(Gln) amidotransferase subunit GatC [Clostridia bacterium]